MLLKLLKLNSYAKVMPVIRLRYQYKHSVNIWTCICMLGNRKLEFLNRTFSSIFLPNSIQINNNKLV